MVFMNFLICVSQIHEADTITRAILQMSELSLREVDDLVQSHTAAEWKSQASNFTA